MSDTTKTALLAAARRLIAEDGFAGTSVRDLAAASGTNVAAVNYHFGSRERLLTQAVLEAFLEWTDEIDRATATLGGLAPAARMLAGLSAVLDGCAEREPLFATVLEAILQSRRSPELHERLAAHYAEQRRRVGAMVSAGVGDLTIPDRYVEIIASLLIAVTDGLQLQSILDPDAIPDGAELRQFAAAAAAVMAGGRA